MEEILDIENISVAYPGVRPVQALEGLTLKVGRGSIYGFLGSNGAGKTTAIKTILGIISPVSGSIKLFGAPLSLSGKAKLGFLPETADYYWYLTPSEILEFYGRLFGMGGRALKTRVGEMLRLVGLENKAGALIKHLSKGTAQKVGLAQALLNDPDLLVLDEPTTGLDPIAKMHMRDILLELKRRGKTIFFSSHELSEVELIADTVGIVKNGRLVKEATPTNIMNEKGEQVSLEKFFFDIVKG